jgi:hypothetical protein
MIDPVSTFLAALLSTATTNVHEQISDIYGTELKTEFIESEEMNISFQYQMWKVKNNTVCSSYSQGTPSYSKCTVKAKSLFSGICKELSKRNDSNWKIKKTKNMYCNALVNYQPVIATISNPKELTEQREKEKQCNLLILKTMGNKNKDLIAERDLMCE